MAKLLSLLAALAIAAAALILAPTECHACPPVVIETEVLELSLEAYEVDGVPAPPPQVYAEAEVSVQAAASEPAELWLRAWSQSPQGDFFVRLR